MVSSGSTLSSRTSSRDGESSLVRSEILNLRQDFGKALSDSADILESRFSKSLKTSSLDLESRIASDLKQVFLSFSDKISENNKALSDSLFSKVINVEQNVGFFC